MTPTETTANTTVRPRWPWLLGALLVHDLIVVVALAIPFHHPSLALLQQSMSFYQLAHGLMQWDSLWFWQIARYGYTLSGVPSLVATAFFPTLPLIIHLVGPTVATLLEQGALAASIWLLPSLLGRMGLTRQQQTLAVWLLALNPALVYYSALYAEPWTLLGVLAAVELAHRRRFGWAAAVSAATTATQGPALLLGLFPLVLFIWSLVQRDGKTARGAFLWGLGCAAGWVGYIVYLGLTFHTPLAFSRVETGPYWQGQWRLPWVSWWLSLHLAQVYHSGPLLLEWALITIFGAGILFLGARGRQVVQSAENLAIFLYALAGLILSTSFGTTYAPFHSTVRFLSMYFPAYAGIATGFGRWLPWFMLLLFAGTGFFGALLFVNQWWYQ